MGKKMQRQNYSRSKAHKKQLSMQKNRSFMICFDWKLTEYANCLRLETAVPQLETSKRKMKLDRLA